MTIVHAGPTAVECASQFEAYSSFSAARVGGWRYSCRALAPAVGDALVAPARGTKQDGADRAALSRLKVVEETRDHVIELLAQTPFGRADLAAIRDVVAALEASAGQAEEQAAGEELAGADSAPICRVGSVWLELKYIRDAASGKAYGPYLSGRWRDAGRKRSKYIRKAPT
jgi:hypothetical protein